MKFAIQGILALFLAISFITSCKKESIEVIVPTTPIDTTMVVPIDTTQVVPVLPGSVLAADSGLYFTYYWNYFYNSPPSVYDFYARLRIEHDTAVYLGDKRISPITPTEGNILRHENGGTITTTINGYPTGTYYEGTAVGTYKFENNTLKVSIVRTLSNGVIQTEVLTYYDARIKMGLTRADYLGTYKGFITSGFNNNINTTITIEADSTQNGVFLKEINRKGYIDDVGYLVLPEVYLNPVDPSQSPYYTAAKVTLAGRVLAFVHQFQYPGEPVPSQQGYTRYTLISQ